MGATGTFAGHFQAATQGCKCRFRQLGRAAPERSRARAIAELRRWPVARTYRFAASPCRYLPPITHRRRKVLAPVRHMNRHASTSRYPCTKHAHNYIICYAGIRKHHAHHRTCCPSLATGAEVPAPPRKRHATPSHCACTYCPHIVPIFLKTPLSRCHVAS